MKKKMLSFALAFSLMLGISGVNTVYADETAIAGTTIQTAVTRNFDTDYSVTWADGLEESWNILTLEENGILDVTFSKVSHDVLGVLNANVDIYDESGKCFYVASDQNDETINAHIYVGLKKGTYYVRLTPEYGTYAQDKTSTFRFAFTANDACELERNDTKETATPIQVDTSYTGYFGSGFSTFADDRDEADLYAVNLVKGQAYKFTFNNAQGTTLIKLLGKNVELGTVWPSVEANDFCVDPGETFVAPYTGTYYAYIYNYLGAQYKYTVKITNVTPKATSLNSVKAGDDSFTASWTKVSCSGYQVQYSTNKNFKSAKTVNVLKSKKSTTIKKLSSNKKYYVRVRTYKKVGDKYAYSSWSNVKSITTK